MKHLPRLAILIALGAASAGAIAADSGAGSAGAGVSDAGPPPHEQWDRHEQWHRHGPGSVPGGILMHVLHRLALTDQQKQQVRDILKNARAQFEAERGNRPDITVIGNPGDPGYDAAIQQLETRASQRVQKESDLEKQIYAVLTDQQKAQLPQVLADMKAHWAKHPPHPPGPPNPSPGG